MNLVYPFARVETRSVVLVVTLLAAAARDTRAQPPAQAPPELTFSPFHENGIYAVGEVAGWTVTIVALAAMPSSMTYTYTAKRNNLDVIKTGTIGAGRPVARRSK